MIIQTVQAAVAILTPSTLQVARSLSSSSTEKTLDLLLYVLIGVGILLIAGVVAVFIWEVRRFRKIFDEHKFL